MKIRITKEGLHGTKGQIPVGTEFDVKEEPTGIEGFYEVIRVVKEDQKPITNPDKAAAEKAAAEAAEKAAADKAKK